MPASEPRPMPRSRSNSAAPRCCSIPPSRKRATRSRWPPACARPSKQADWHAWPAASRSSPTRNRRVRNSASWALESLRRASTGQDPRVRPAQHPGPTRMKLPEPPLLIVTDRRQARLPLAEVVRAAVAAGCRWVSVREKDLSDEDQIALAATLLPIVRRYDARLTLHGEAAFAKACGVDGVHRPAGSDAAAGRAVLGPHKLIGVSLHTVTEAEAIDPDVVDYAVAGPAFETASKPGYGPEIGRKGLTEIARAASVPILAIAGLNATRAAARADW